MKYNFIGYLIGPNMSCVSNGAVNLEMLDIVLSYLARAWLRWRETITFVQFTKHFPKEYASLIFPTSLRDSNVIPISQRGKLGLEPLAGEFGKLSTSDS